MPTTKDLRLMPWRQTPGGCWSQGNFVSLDGAAVGSVAEEDVAEVLYFWSDGDTWDGDEIAVMRLADGRYVAYETWYGPTGDGFSEDAYGGDANLYFASSLAEVLRLGLGDEARRKIGVEN
jgi:hypothetical protein